MKNNFVLLIVVVAVAFVTGEIRGEANDPYNYYIYHADGTKTMKPRTPPVTAWDFPGPDNGHHPVSGSHSSSSGPGASGSRASSTWGYASGVRTEGWDYENPTKSACTDLAHSYPYFLLNKIANENYVTEQLIKKHLDAKYTYLYLAGISLDGTTTDDSGCNYFITMNYLMPDEAGKPEKSCDLKVTMHKKRHGYNMPPDFKSSTVTVIDTGDMKSLVTAIDNIEEAGWSCKKIDNKRSEGEKEWNNSGISRLPTGIGCSDLAHSFPAEAIKDYVSMVSNLSQSGGGYLAGSENYLQQNLGPGKHTAYFAGVSIDKVGITETGCDFTATLRFLVPNGAQDTQSCEMQIAAHRNTYDEVRIDQDRLNVGYGYAVYHLLDPKFSNWNCKPTSVNN